jgi:hypothetical protein
MIAMVARGGVIVAECLAFYVLAEWVAAAFSRTTPDAVSWYWFVLLGVIGYGLPRLVDAGRRTGVLSAVVAGFVIYLALRITVAGDMALWDFGWVRDFVNQDDDRALATGAVVASMLILGGAWVRAALQSDEGVELETVPSTLAWSFMLVTIVVVAATASDRSAEVARAAAAFYGVAVVALACSQLALSGATFGDLRAGGTVSLLLGITAGVTALGVLLSWLLLGTAGPVIGPPLARVTEVVLYAVLFPPAWLIEKIVSFIFSGGNAEGFELTNFAREVAEGRGEGAGEPAAGERIAAYSLRAFALIVVLAIGAVVAAWVARRMGRGRRGFSQGGVSTPSGSLASDLLGLFRKNPSPAPAPEGDTPARRLYVAMLHDAERAGRARGVAETPREFAPHAREALHTEAVLPATALFIESRYAGREPGEADVREAERQLHARQRAARASTRQAHPGP